MPRTGTKHSYRVKYCKHFPIKDNGIATSFSFGERIKNTDPAQYQNYSFVVWGNLDIMDGDNVNILTIDSIEVNSKNGKLYVNLSGTVQVIKTETAQYAEEQAPAFIPPVDPPRNDDGTLQEFSLPFDL